jgi:Flp pilus assembly protein TadG
MRKPRPAGQATVEFAAAATIFPIVFFALIQLAAAVYTYSTICEAAQEAVRYAIVNGPQSTTPATNAEVQAVAQSYAPGLTLTTTVTWPTDSLLPAQQDAKVAITCSYPLSIPFMKAITLNFSTSYAMVISPPPTSS